MDELLTLHQDWILACVREQVGRVIRRKFESCDIQNDANERALIALRKMDPRVIHDAQHFRNWLRLKVKQEIWDARDHLDGSGDPQSLEARMTAGEDAACSSRDDPFQAAMIQERNGAALAAMALLSAEDQSLFTARNWERLSFEEIGARLGIQAAAADTRYRRAMARFTDAYARVLRNR